MLVAGCYPPSAPPIPPRVQGFVEARGGSLGDWRLDATRIERVEGMLAVDVTNPAAPGLVLRVASVDPSLVPGVSRAYLASRTSQLRVANLAGANGKVEVLLSPEHCTKLDSILRQRSFQFDPMPDDLSGSARFDCDLGAAGHLVGDVEFSLWGWSAGNVLNGHIDATDGALGPTAFTPSRCDADNTGVLFWDAMHPRVLLDVEEGPADTSVIGAASNGTVRVTSTERAGESFELSPRDCRVLRLSQGMRGSGVSSSLPWSSRSPPPR
jgi:hypothetical protein